MFGILDFLVGSQASEVPELSSLMVSAPPPPPQTQWYIAQNSQQLGPFGFNQLLQQGLTSQTLVWTAGQNGWKQALEVPELSSLLGSVPPPPPIG
ncbi:MAG: DUF4339 domain-containing protein [Potamolinea sp.]